jgi:2-amino-4-hydroxy-6-hydroxymethyldihydropteridine diphosphokinase
MRTAVALGSNIEDRLHHLRTARDHLRTLHNDQAPFLASRIYETAPVDCPPGSPAFLNAAIALSTDLPPLDLLAALQHIEQTLGRPRDHAHHAPRTIDLDILFCDNLAFTLPELTIPHPRLAERAFVLAPLADIEPDRILPGHHLTVRQLLATLATTPPTIADFLT